ncbi:hypothetical protein ACXYMU_09660 [Pontibacter sp. CAU 1760]
MSKSDPGNPGLPLRVNGEAVLRPNKTGKLIALFFRLKAKGCKLNRNAEKLHGLYEWFLSELEVARTTFPNWPKSWRRPAISLIRRLRERGNGCKKS